MVSSSNKVHWESVDATRGVLKAVTLDHIYRTISSEVIASLKWRCDENGVVQTGRDIISGDHAKIEKGPFTDFFCKIEKIVDSQRAWVLIENLQQKTRTKVALNYLSRVH